MYMCKVKQATLKLKNQHHNADCPISIDSATEIQLPVFGELQWVFGACEVSPFLAIRTTTFDPSPVVASQILQLMETISGRIDSAFLEMIIRN